MTETVPSLPPEGLVTEVLYNPAPAAAEASQVSVLDPNNWLIMKQTDLPTIERQIAEGTALVVAEHGTPFFFLNNFPDMLPGGRRTVGKLKAALASDDPTVGHAALRRGDPSAWSEQDKLLHSDRMRSTTNGAFYAELAEAVNQAGADQVAGLSASDFERLNGLRTIGKLRGDDLRKHYEFELEVYKRMRQAGFSHGDLWK